MILQAETPFWLQQILLCCSFSSSFMNSWRRESPCFHRNVFLPMALASSSEGITPQQFSAAIRTEPLEGSWSKGQGKYWPLLVTGGIPKWQQPEKQPRHSKTLMDEHKSSGVMFNNSMKLSKFTWRIWYKEFLQSFRVKTGVCSGSAISLFPGQRKCLVGEEELHQLLAINFLQI